MYRGESRDKRCSLEATESALIRANGGRRARVMKRENELVFRKLLRKRSDGCGTEKCC